MRLSGKLIKNTTIIKEALVEAGDENTPFRDVLEECLINLCRELDIQVPLWLKKNSREFVNFHGTSFNHEHFVEAIKFDRLEIRIE